MIAILRVRFTSNSDPASTWSDDIFSNWMHPAIPFSLANYWWVSGWGQFDLNYKLFPEIVIDDPRPPALIATTASRGPLVDGCIKQAASKLGMTFDDYDVVMIWFAQPTDMFGGQMSSVPVSNGHTKVVPVTVVDLASWFSGCCQELGHSYGFQHELSPTGDEYGSPYSAMSARGDLEFLRPQDARLPDGPRITDPKDGFIGYPPQWIIGPALPAAQLYALDWFRNSPLANTALWDSNGCSPVFTLYALDYARDRRDEKPYPVLAVLNGYSGRHYALELRRKQGFDQGVTPALVVHSFDVDHQGVPSSRVRFEAAAPLPPWSALTPAGDTHFGSHSAPSTDWPFPPAPFTVRFLNTGIDNSSITFQAFQGVWTQLDNNHDSADIVADGPNLYQIHKTGGIWKYTGVPSGWLELDANGDSAKIAASGGNLYQMHRTGRIWKYTGVPHTGWLELDANADTKDIVADGSDLYQIHKTGKIWKYTGVPHTGWIELDSNGDSVKIVASGGNLYQLHRTGRIWKYTGVPHTGWLELDANGDTVDIVADGDHLYQLHKTGKVWIYTGTPHTGWKPLDSNPATRQIAAGGNKLFQLHNTGRIWRFTGSPQWFELDHNSASVKIVAATNQLYQMHNSGEIWALDTYT